MQSINHARTIRATALALATTTGIGLASPASAEDAPGRDWKGYTASNCLAQSGTSELRRGVPHIANTAKRTTSFICPLVRDVAEGGPNRLELVRVRVRDRHPTLNVRCILRSHSISGATVDSDQAQSSGTGFRTLTLGPVDANNFGSYSLICQVPGRGARNAYLPSYLVNYRADESTL